MKNGLLRVQCYLTEDAYKEFSAELEEFNKNLEGESKSKLSESGFCQMKLTGAFPRLRGAPKGNKNALGRKANSLPDCAVNEVAKAAEDAISLRENRQSFTDDFEQDALSDNPARLPPASSIPADNNISVENDFDGTNSSERILVDSIAFPEENSSENVSEEATDLSQSKSRATKEDSTSKSVNPTSAKIQFTEEETDRLLENIGYHN